MGRHIARRGLVFAVTFAAVVGWLLVDLLARRVRLPGELRYIVPGYELLIATGSPDRIWSAVDDHFGTFIRNDPYRGPLFTALDKVRDDLAEKKLAVKTVDDIHALGLDKTRGVVVANYPSGHSLAVLNASDVPRLLQTLARYETSTDAPPLESDVVARIGKWYVANPEGRLVVVSDDEDALKASLTSVRDVALYQSASDDLYEAVVEDLGVPMLTGASVLAVYNDSSTALLRRLVAVASIDQRGIAITGTAQLEVSPYKVIQSFLGPPPVLSPWPDQLAADTVGGLMLRDHKLAQYLDALAQARQLGPFMRDRYAGVLAELRGLPSLRQLSLAITDFHNGLPDLALVAWADPAAMDAMVARIQVRVRVRRDQEVLRGALEAGEQTEEEPDALFSRYRVHDGIVDAAELTANDFANRSYERRAGDTVIRLLLPPVTSNDVKYRREIRDIKDHADLMTDRYRLAAARVGETFWFATDPAVIERRLQRQADVPTFAMTDLFQMARREFQRRDRMQAFVSMDRLLEIAALSPDIDLDKGLLKYARELRSHPAISLAVSAAQTPPRVSLRMRLDRRP